MSLLGSSFEFWYHLLVGAGDKMLGDLVVFVQPLCTVHSRSFSMRRNKGLVNDCRILVHKLLGHGTAARPGVQSLVDVLEDWAQMPPSVLEYQAEAQ